MSSWPAHVRVNTFEFGTMVCCAVRHCIHKQPLSTTTMIAFARTLLPDLSDKALKEMQSDIESATNIRGDVDEHIWLEFADELAAELKKRWCDV